MTNLFGGRLNRLGEKDMKKTNEKIGLYCKEMGWNFERVIYADEKGKEYIKINGGFIDLEWATMKADSYHRDYK